MPKISEDKKRWLEFLEQCIRSAKAALIMYPQDRKQTKKQLKKYKKALKKAKKEKW